MSDLHQVLAEVEGRVGYLRALTAVPDEAGWVRADALGAADVAAALVGSKAGGDRVVAASLFAQSYAFRVAGVSLAAYAVGLPWPSPAAGAVAVRLGGGRASMLAFLTDDLGDPDDGPALRSQLADHMAPFAATVGGVVRLGPQLLAGNVASSLAAAFRAVEGAARQRGASTEALTVRDRGVALLEGWGGGRFADDAEWSWQRSSCCLWFRTSGRTCEDCSLRRRATPTLPTVPITPDTKDWTWVLERPCSECGFDASGVAVDDVADLIEANAAAWPAVLDQPDARRRPADDRWSALEYGCHVRDVFRLYDERLRLMLETDDPLYPNWDQDATAEAERYGEQDPATVAGELEAAAAALAGRFRTVTPAAWSRTGRRSDGAHFTVDTFSRYLLHDPVHHLHDVAR